MARGAKIEGPVYIGKNTKVFEGAVIKGPTYIGDNCLVGNNVLIREYTDLESGVMVGTGVEITRSIFQENCSTHSGFFGDSIFGKNCKIAAGTITANKRIDQGEICSFVKGEKTGTCQKKLGTIMGENSRVGIRASFMPGVLVGRDCVIGPNSVISENISDNSVFYTKFKKIIKTKVVK